MPQPPCQASLNFKISPRLSCTGGCQKGKGTAVSERRVKNSKWTEWKKGENEQGKTDRLDP